MQDYNQAFAHIAALTQADPNTFEIDVRMIHDVDKDVAAIPRRGLLPALWNEIVAWNNQGYGAHVTLNMLDGMGREIANVQAIRCQAIDLDNLSAPQNYQRAIQFVPSPAFACNSSPGKYHVYWQTPYHTNKDGFTLLQRKLRTLFDGDKTIVDPSRTLRLAGTYHLKNPQAPHLVSIWSLDNFNRLVDPALLEQALAGVNVIEGSGGRSELGDPKLQAPGFEWCVRALLEADPNNMDRGEWISFSSAWKQASWNYAPEDQLKEIWLNWCSRYQGNDIGENIKNWNSIKNTEVGWLSIERRIPNIAALRTFADRKLDYQQKQLEPTPPPRPLSSDVPAPDMPLPMPQLEIPVGEMLTDSEQRTYFQGCVFIERQGEILTPKGRFMNSTKFNGTYGGKKFIIDSIGKVTTEAWQAATRSTLWTIPKVDHIRFVPSMNQGELIKDQLGRVGVNTYRPAEIDSRPGDISPFLRHMELLLPQGIDRGILFDYLAHNAKFPGFKIPWAPLIQSAEGAGKGLIKRLASHMLGAPYVYFPKAQELIDSGSKFNAWMRSRLFIIVDEIKVDERRDMIEILKPMISEEQIEIQAKGIDQDIEDNFANWCFFSNYKDAIPINKNSRRFSIFYSAIQAKADLSDRGMDETYFTNLYRWMDNGGAAYVTHWLRQREIAYGSIPMRAPLTTSNHEAVQQSRGPVEMMILDAIQDMVPGFRGGWVSSIAVQNRLKGTSVRPVSGKTLTTIMEAMGYHHIGRALRPYFAENKDWRADLYSFDRNASLDQFGRWQGYD